MLAESTNQVSFKSVHFILYLSRRFTWMQPASWKTRIQTVAEVGRPYRLYPMTSVRFRVAKKAIFQNEYNHILAMVMLLYRTLESALGHDTVIPRR